MTKDSNVETSTKQVKITREYCEKRSFWDRLTGKNKPQKHTLRFTTLVI